MCPSYTTTLGSILNDLFLVDSPYFAMPCIFMVDDEITVWLGDLAMWSSARNSSLTKGTLVISQILVMNPIKIIRKSNRCRQLLSFSLFFLILDSYFSNVFIIACPCSKYTSNPGSLCLSFEIFNFKFKLCHYSFVYQVWAFSKIEVHVLNGQNKDNINLESIYRHKKLHEHTIFTDVKHHLNNNYFEKCQFKDN